MELVNRLVSFVFESLERVWSIFLSPHHVFYWGYLLTFLLAGIISYLLVRKKGPQAGGLFGHIFPKSLYTHPSTVLDLKLVVVNRILGLNRFAGLVIGTIVVANGVSWAITSVAGAPPITLSQGPVELAIATLVFLLAADFSTFLNHYLHHKIPILWELHKVHHSSEVLTPLTLYRKHPLYDNNKVIVRSLILGTTVGVGYWMFGEIPNEYEILGINAIMALMNLGSANLRHSQFWVDFGPVFSRIFISPAQHHIHHSAAEKHRDKNFGESLAIWDWMWGTLYVPKEREVLTFGVAEGVPQEHNTVWQAYWRPIENMVGMVVPSAVPVMRSVGSKSMNRLRRLRSARTRSGAVAEMNTDTNALSS